MQKRMMQQQDRAPTIGNIITNNSVLQLLLLSIDLLTLHLPPVRSPLKHDVQTIVKLLQLQDLQSFPAICQQEKQELFCRMLTALHEPHDILDGLLQVWQSEWQAGATQLTLSQQQPGAGQQRDVFVFMILWEADPQVWQAVEFRQVQQSKRQLRQPVWLGLAYCWKAHTEQLLELATIEHIPLYQMMHELEHPSPSIVLPSSHSSKVTFIMASPHNAMHMLLDVAQPVEQLSHTTVKLAF